MTAIITGVTGEARAEFVEWLRGVLAAPENAERHADAALAEIDWGARRSYEARGHYTRSGAPDVYEFAPDDLRCEPLD